MGTSNAKTIFNKYAKKYEEQYMSVDFYTSTLNLFCKSLPKKSQLLDIGCGPGNVTQHLLQQRPDLNVLGIDIAPNMIALAQKNNPTATFKVMDSADISELKDTYHGIVCAFLLPYLSKQQAIGFINSISKLLKKDGVLYISTMEGLNSNSKLQSSSHDKKDQLFINYHEAGYLTDTLQKNNLELLFSTLQDYPQKDGTTTTDLIIISKK